VFTDFQLANPIYKRRHQTAIVIAAFIAAFIISLFLDIPLSTLAHTSGLAPWMKNHNLLTHLIRLPGNFIYTAVICVALILSIISARARGLPYVWTKPAIIFLAGIYSAINSPMKWLVGRIRPYHGVTPFQLHPFTVGLEHVEASFSFPSGDATIAFAMAVALSITIPNLRALWWTLAIIVGIERICENAHYPSDVIAGAAVGIAMALLAKKTVLHLSKKNANPPEKTIIPS
jgi:membrane-associated phospholipid phosphatase